MTALASLKAQDSGLVLTQLLSDVMVGMAQVVSSIKKRTTVDKLLFTAMLSNFKFCLTCFIRHSMPDTRRMVLPKWFARFKNSLYCEFKGGHNLNDRVKINTLVFTFNHPLLLLLLNITG